MGRDPNQPCTEISIYQTHSPFLQSYAHFACLRLDCCVRTANTPFSLSIKKSRMLHKYPLPRVGRSSTAK
jgi:hypothetical protein